MKEVQVNVPGHSYTIKLGSGVIKDLPAELKRLNPSSCLLRLTAKSVSYTHLTLPTN